MSGIVLLLLRTLAALALYLFLGWALLTLWKDLRQQQTNLQSQRKPGLFLQIGEERAQRFAGPSAQRFAGPELILGRDPQCDCVLASETVSARHARISFHHEQWWLEDLGSTNGTFLNQEPVQVPTVVVPGDQIRCGEMVIHLLDEETPA